ncbi:MAG: transposase, partial [Candidatus Zixiibacteriota bacterium]
AGVSLSEVVRAFKSFSARRINEVRGATGTPFWQRNYYEHIVRDEDELHRIRHYILNNVYRWHDDPENPESITVESREHERERNPLYH